MESLITLIARRGQSNNNNLVQRQVEWASCTKRKSSPTDGYQ